MFENEHRKPLSNHTITITFFYKHQTSLLSHPLKRFNVIRRHHDRYHSR